MTGNIERNGEQPRRDQRLSAAFAISIRCIVVGCVPRRICAHAGGVGSTNPVT